MIWKHQKYINLKQIKNKKNNNFFQRCFRKALPNRKNLTSGIILLLGIDVKPKCDVLNFWWHELMSFHPKEISWDEAECFALFVRLSLPALTSELWVHRSSKHTLMLEEWNELRWIVMEEWKCWRGSLKCRSILRWIKICATTFIRYLSLACKIFK